MTLYLCGPISSDDNARAEANLAAFEVTERKLTAKGYKVCNPIDNVNPSWRWEKCMRVTIAHMLTCDAVYMLKGWDHSRGAVIEHGLAVSIGMMVYDERTL